MHIQVFNECEYIVKLSLESGQTLKIGPKKSAIINCTQNDIHISIGRDIESFKKRSKYILVLETKYKVINIQNNEIFRITHEKTKVGINVYYDRLLMCAEKASCLIESNNVVGAAKIKNVFNKSRRKYIFLISPFESGTELAIFLILLGIALCYMIDWKIGIVYFPSMYLVLLLLDRIAEKIVLRVFKMQDEKTEFNDFCEPEFIENILQIKNKCN